MNFELQSLTLSAFLTNHQLSKSFKTILTKEMDQFSQDTLKYLINEYIGLDFRGFNP